MDDFGGRVVVITGAGSGIGAALAHGFAAEGATIAAVDIDGDAAAETATAVGGSSSAHAVDVGDGDAVERLAAEIYERHSKVDVLVNNAGVFQGGLMWERTAEDWRWTFDVNVFGIINAVRSFVPRMLAAGGEGHIVNTASVAAFVAGAGVSPYIVSKCAAMSVTECLALDLAAVGSQIGVSVLTPSAFVTGIAHTARVRSEQYGVDDTADGQATIAALAKQTDAGMDPSAVVAPVLAGIRAKDFLIPTRPSYADQIRNRYEALLERRLPGPVLVD